MRHGAMTTGAFDAGGCHLSAFENPVKRIEDACVFKFKENNDKSGEEDMQNTAHASRKLMRRS